MKKLLTITLTSAFLFGGSAAYANSTIEIPTPTNNVVLANTEMELNLNPLLTDAPYMVTCELDSNSPTDLDVIFTPYLAPNGGYGVNKANGKAMMKNTGTFQSGKNTFSFMTSIADKNAANKLVLKNLDNRYSVAVKSCQALPVSNVTAAANQVAGGYFYISNHFYVYLDVTVGNFVPTPYCIPPRTKQYVAVSTAYQDIDVVGTHY